jgi:hypothetical protein
MAAKNRPSLASLSDRLARKDPPAPAPAAEADPPPTPARSEPKERRVQVLVRMTPAERKALRRIALEGDTTVQALVEDAIRDVIRRHDG